MYTSCLCHVSRNCREGELKGDGNQEVLQSTCMTLSERVDGSLVEMHDLQCNRQYHDCSIHLKVHKQRDRTDRALCFSKVSRRNDRFVSFCFA